jgi:hypothetical protein
LVSAGLLAGLLAGCAAGLLPTPAQIGGGRGGSGAEEDGALKAPAGLSASQGLKQTITVQWEPVAGARRYLLYASESPLLPFEQAGETRDAATSFSFVCRPGATVWYRVRALGAGGELSASSAAVRGTSLAKPLISDVTEAPDNPENASIVYWYMENAEEATYLSKLRYIVTCYDGAGLQAAQTAVDGSAGAASALFYGLAANTAYTYQVEAFLAEAQDASETSERVDAATARRLRPAAPRGLSAAPGSSAQTITLAFTLPEPVDVYAGDKSYESHPLYFTIARRAAGTSEPFVILCPYLGADAEKKAASGAGALLLSDLNPELAAYTEGAQVTWSAQMAALERGKEFEFRVQAFADGTAARVSSDQSAAAVVSWTMKRPALSVNLPVYTLTEAEDFYAAAELSITFSHDAKGVAYTYVLHETRAPVGDEPSGAFAGFDLAAPVTRDFTLALDGMAAFKTQVDLTRASTESSAGRGRYSYAADVFLGETLIETLQAVTSRRVTESTDISIVENFSVLDGFVDKFVLVWDRDAERDYQIQISDAESPGDDDWDDAALLEAGEGGASGYRWSLTAQEPGLTRAFRIRARKPGNGWGDWETAEQKITMGKPVLSRPASLAYGEVTVTWEAVQGADAYRLRYVDDRGVEHTGTPVPLAEVPTLEGRLAFVFTPPGALDASRAGKALSVRVEALNQARQQAEIEDGQGDAELALASEALTTRLLGPAELFSSATQASAGTSSTSITLTWKTVEGAAGYYVARRQFKLDNSAALAGTETLYYVDAAAAGVLGKAIEEVDGVREDTAEVNAQVTLNDGTYTLSDLYMTDGDFAAKADRFGAYALSQNDLAWGYPYRYHVLPVLSEDDAPVFDYAAGTYTAGGHAYTAHTADALERSGWALGFAQQVTATKGTYAQGADGNDAVRITWSPPPQTTGTVHYYLYRRQQNPPGSAWEQIGGILSSASHIDTSAVPGRAYDYLAGAFSGESGASRPDQNARFVAASEAVMDETFGTERRMAGFIAAMPSFTLVSRDARGSAASGFYETVQWNASGVDNAASSNKNRGVSGYRIEVRNADLDAAWHTVVDKAAAPTGAAFDHNVDNSGGLLKVLRGYRHYYRIRSYIDMGGGELVFSKTPPDPENFSGAETAYIKWGARQVTKEEFIKAAMLVFADGLSQFGLINGTDVTKNGSTGTVHYDYCWIPTGQYNYQFSSYSRSFSTPGGVTSNWLTLSSNEGRFEVPAAGTTWYKNFNRKDITVTVTGPAGTDIASYGSGSFVFSSSSRTHAKFSSINYSNGESASSIEVNTYDNRRRYVPIRYTDDDEWWMQDTALGWW